MKYTIFLTRNCNLRCSYCYIRKEAGTAMSPAIASRVVDFIYRHVPDDERISIGFFGGEPLLEPNLLNWVACQVESHQDYDPSRVDLAVVSNGTQLTPDIEGILLNHGISYFVSCDGPPEVHDVNRRDIAGARTSPIVERNLRRALDHLPHVAVNAVIHPGTLRELPRTVRYFAGLGLREIHLSPDYSAQWTGKDVMALPAVLAKVADLYANAQREGAPIFVSLIDTKIAVILRGGYEPTERCRMGRGELAFTPSGRIYPCERLVGDDNGRDHCIGTLDGGVDIGVMACRQVPGDGCNDECSSCAISELCMNWCGCSNYFATGFYNRVNEFQCAFEKATIGVALEVFQLLDRELGPVFAEHLAGRPENSLFPRTQLPILNQAAPGRGWRQSLLATKEA